MTIIKNFLEISILSYNRTNELERIFRSLDSIDRDDVKVCVYEDCSPNQALIREICKKYSDELIIDIEFKPSVINLGYDKNLLRAFSSESEYILLLSDDDFIEASFLDHFIDTLRSKSPDILISPYTTPDISRIGAHFNEAYSIDVLYDSILFSGLTFKVKSVSITKDEEDFLSQSIYVQVFLLCKYWNTSCGYFDKPLVIAGSDGENYFGKSDVSSQMKTLSDRSALMSNIHYQVYFQRVVFKSLNLYYPDLVKQFMINYSKRLVSHFIRVRLKSSLAQYIKSILEFRKINVAYNSSYMFFILIIIFLPKFLLRPLYNILINKFRISGG